MNCLLLITAVDEKKLEKSDAFGYAKYLTELLNDGNDFGISIIGYDPNISNQNPTTTAIIWMNDSEAEPFLFETGEETSLEYGRCTYFIYNPNTEMVKIPYQDYINLFEDLKTVTSGENFSIDIEGYKIGDLTISQSNFIDFGGVTKYKDMWFGWCRGITYIFMVIYNINQVLKLLRGFSVTDGTNLLRGGSKHDN